MSNNSKATLVAWHCSPILIALCAAPMVIQLLALATPGYGYLIDELYYLACSKRLAFGYVDHPPLSILVLAGTRLLVGESLLDIRILPILAAGATTWATAVLAGKLGGGRFAQIIATLSIGTCPLLLAVTSYYSMNAFEPLLWTLIVLTFVHLTQSNQPRLWLWIGVIAGLGMENKHTFFVFLAALSASVLLTDLRRASTNRWFWLGLGLALLLITPNILWQFANGFPSLEFYRNAQTLKNLPTPPVKAIITVILAANPATLPVWLAGAIYLIFSRRARAYRSLGVSFVILFATYIAAHTSRADRLLPAFPMLMAAGGVALERFVVNRSKRIALVAPILAVGIGVAPIVVPLLPPAKLVHYMAAMGFKNSSFERGKSSPIPQPLADRTGWESFAQDMKRVYESLPSEDKSGASFFVPDYGHAGAIELWGPALGLPDVVSPHNNYWYWSANHLSGRTLIAVSPDVQRLKQLFKDIRRVNTVKCDFCMNWRSNMPIYIARDPTGSLGLMWGELKCFL